MRSRNGVAWLLAALLCAAAHAADDDQDDDAPDERRRPEHQARPLPADTFKPSEEISEDFPVPFPVDI